MRHRDSKARNGCAIDLEPATPEALTAPARYRDAATDATGIRRPDHDEHVFHVGLAYRVGCLTTAESDDMEVTLAAAHDEMDTPDTFMLDAPVLAFFDDMLEYRTGSRSSAALSSPAAQR